MSSSSQCSSALSSFTLSLDGVAVGGSAGEENGVGMVPMGGGHRIGGYWYHR